MAENFKDELADRRCMKTFKGLFDTCAQEPMRAYRLLLEAQRCPEAYPVQHAVIFMIGMFFGCMVAGRDGYETAMSDLLNSHVDLMHCLDTLGETPEDFIGPKRKYGRTGQYPVPPKGSA